MIPGIGTIVNGVGVLVVGILSRVIFKKELKDFEDNLLPLGLLVLALGLRESLKSPDYVRLINFEISGFIFTLFAVIIGAVIGNFLDEFKFREDIKSLMNLARNGNKFLAESEPWKLQKSNPEKVKEILYVGYIISCYLSILSEPFLPFTSNKLKSQLNLGEIDSWSELENLDSKIDFSFKIKSEGVLFRKIEDDEIIKQVEKLNKMSSQ